MVSLKETSVDLLSTCYDQGSLSEENTVLFLTLMDLLPFVEQVFILLLSFSEDRKSVV